jgi:3-hydroxyacyl-[acyl-carrier-protein] dehydratase
MSAKPVLVTEQPQSMENSYRLGFEQVRRFLPHRAPFLLVDRILEIHPVGDVRGGGLAASKVGVKVAGLKNVTFNEPFFQGHFPQFAIFPGVLMIEAMAQVACFSLYPYFEHDLDAISRDFQCVLVGVDAVRFRRPVVPGDSLRIETEVTKHRGQMLGFKGVALVDGQKVAEADILTSVSFKGAV